MFLLVDIVYYVQRHVDVKGRDGGLQAEPNEMREMLRDFQGRTPPDPESPR